MAVIPAKIHVGSSEPLHYPDSFFDSIEDGALRSARVVVPILLGVIKPSSVIDVGCGRGAWLKVFQEHGVPNVKGIDGDYIDPNKLLIPERDFSTVDLSKPFNIESRYDLALCLEVAEHLPPSMGSHLVQQLTAAAPLILFSAAIPGQGGVRHVNEQWLSYWERQFAHHRFLLLDPIRRHIRHNRAVEWWYRQNIVLFASVEAISKSQQLSDEREHVLDSDIDWIHANVLHGCESVRGLLKLLPRLLLANVHRRTRALASIHRS